MTGQANSPHSDSALEHALRLYREGRLDDALAAFNQLIATEPQNDELYAHAALVMQQAGNVGGAVEYYAKAISLNPDNVSYKDRLADVFARTELSMFHPQMKALVLDCLLTPGIDHQKIMLAWFSLFRLDPEYKPLWDAAQFESYDDFEIALEDFDDYEALGQPYFLLGLQYLLVADPAFERLVTFLRRYFLEQMTEEMLSVFLDDIAVPLLSSLAQYFFRTEYLPDEHEEERALLASWDEDSARAHALRACYRPLYQDEHADHAVAVLPDAGDEARTLVAVQFESWQAQQKIRAEIETLTPVDNKVSQDVREQYEGFPYPRWQTLASSLSADRLENFLTPEIFAPLKKEGAQILVAGCGTGRQALEYGVAFPQAEILAVDLSLSSLAYAIDKQRARGINNVRFGQADILALPSLNQSFDLIVSTGVLHHMEDPLAGWQALERCLKPGGLMRIALYSSIARQFIVRGRDVIAREGFGSDAAGIRAFRRHADELMSAEDMEIISNTLDYYAMSECRDMLFHVQEHQYDLLRLRQEIDTLGLDFLKFELHPAIIAQYRQAFAQDESATDLSCWHAFEQQNPMLFLQMYRFWCRKN
ncbi:MAG: methyltransferase domain-containing protein [Rhodospirillales bacterium]|nr:methyltransferase domain-containing protein [Rhodospirillales bacterium]MCB9996326.1 methyltransferase domain-containing protein [Rhodospirillales bacterium]